MASNQGWSGEKTQTHQRGGGMHQLKEVDMLAAKLDLLMKRLDERTVEKKEVLGCKVLGGCELHQLHQQKSRLEPATTAKLLR